MKVVALFFSLLMIGFYSFSQVNAYAKVASISGNVLTVNSVHEAFDSFEDGEQLILIQMQDVSIGGNTTNNASFGMLNAILTCGNYEIVTLASHTELAGTPNSLTLTGPLTKTYEPSASLQIISFPTLGGATFSTTSNMSALPWDGNIGGIIAFRVNGKLDLHHSIEANAKGFRGGAKSGNDGTSCINSVYSTAVSAAHASKGEGVFANVFGSPAHAFSAGRAPLVNGGGGASVHNAGGGGGSHISSGGNGGDGWSCSPGSGGIGAYSLAPYANVNRIFMGGGGGGGQENNNQGTSGTNGGGIVLIHADSIIVDACNVFISANGGDAITSVSDGAGGAGAGGTIVLQVNGIRVKNACSFLVSSNGGDGGNVTSISTHGGGGGGGQGAIYTPLVLPIANVQVEALNGTGGLGAIGPTAPQAEGGGGSNNTGINPQVETPLPIVLRKFVVTKAGEYAQVTWEVSSELNIDRYELMMSTDGVHWEIIDIQYAQNLRANTRYVNENFITSARMYYKLAIIDNEDEPSYSSVLVLDTGISPLLRIYPNPIVSFLNVESDSTVLAINMYSITGQFLLSLPVGKPHYDLSDLPPGCFLLEVITEKGVQRISLIRSE